MGLADGPSQSVLGPWHRNQVDVIGHQAVGPYFDAAFSAPLGHQTDVGGVVLIMEEGLLPTISPLRNVMG